MPRKRSKQKIESKESIALKKMRLAQGLSLKRAAKKSGIHDTLINHFENGWSTVTEAYIQKFIHGMGYGQKDWDDFLQGRVTTFDLRDECSSIIQKMDGEKLKGIHAMLVSFAS
jgi:transcriptional regulator with XRE-family HTH domain